MTLKAGLKSCVLSKNFAIYNFNALRIIYYLRNQHFTPPIDNRFQVHNTYFFRIITVLTYQ